MNCVTHNITISANEPRCLIPVSDIHMGHVDFDKDFACKTIAWIKKKGAMVFLIGDLIDGICHKDVRFENDSIAPDFKHRLGDLHVYQVERVLELLDPIKDQIIFTMAGNHEDTVLKHYLYPATKTIADALGVPVLTDPGYCVLKFDDSGSKRSVNCLCTHGGFLGGRMRGAKVNAMERLPASFEADLYFAGHTHDVWVTKKTPVRLSRKGKIEKKKIYFVNTGSFMDTYLESEVSTWASRKLFDPIAPGVARVDFYSKKKRGTRYLDIHTRA